MININDVVKNGLELLGVPWVHGGRDRKLGLDCQGVILESYYPAGWQPKDKEAVDDLSYGRHPSVERMKKVLEGEGEKFGVCDIIPGDVILFKPFHLALATSVSGGRVYFIHSNQKIGKVTHTHLDESWKRRYIQSYRFVE